VGDDYGWLRTRNVSVLALGVSAAHVLVLGVPTFLALNWRNAIRWWSSLLAGLVLGAIPLGIAWWPLDYSGLKSSASHSSFGGKMVYTMIDGVPTLAGWIEYLVSVAAMGLLGALGGISFWLVWRRWRSEAAAVRAAE
jgi:hypothetical protein